MAGEYVEGLQYRLQLGWCCPEELGAGFESVLESAVELAMEPAPDRCWNRRSSRRGSGHGSGARVGAGVGAIVSAVALEYRISVKVSWDFSMSLDSPGCKAFRKAGIQAFYSGASQNFTGVILALGYHGWNSRFQPYSSASAQCDSLWEYATVSTLLVRRGTGNPVLSVLPEAQSYRYAAKRIEAPRFRKMAKNPPQNIHFRYLTV